MVVKRIPQASSRRPLVYLTHLFNHCLRLSHFPEPWKEAKFIMVPKPGKDPKFPQNLRPISLLSAIGKLFEEVILKIVQRHIEERDLLNASQFGFLARHSTTFQYMRVTDHVTLNFNNNISTTAVFLNVEKTFDITWHLGLLYELSELNFRAILSRLLDHFFLRESSETRPKLKCLRLGVYKQGCHNVPSYPSHITVYIYTYINYTPQTPGVYLGLFADETCICATDRKESYVVRKLQRVLSAIEV
jgi:hypothetical protein